MSTSYAEFEAVKKVVKDRAYRYGYARGRFDEALSRSTGVAADCIYTGWGMVIVPAKWRLGVMENKAGQWLIAIGPLRFAKMRLIP